MNRKGLAEPVFGFRRDGGRLLRVNGYPPEALVSFDRSIESEFDPNDAAAQLEKASPGRRVPFAWWQNISGDGQIAYRDGRYFRPCGGGQVRVLQGQEVTILTPRLKLTNWKMLLSPYGDYGYGAGGVYRLDENLCPVSQLITTGSPLRVDAGLVMQMGCDAKTLAILVRDVRHETTFQVWTRDGQTQLREESLGRDYYVPDRGRVQALDGGYLLSVNELIWVPAAPGGRTWRCDPLGAEGRRNEFGPLRFGIPATVCGKIFVTCADGIYVFDESKITGAAHVNAAPPTGPRPIEEGIVMKRKGADPAKKITVLTIP